MIPKLNTPMLKRYLRRLVQGRSEILDAATRTTIVGEEKQVRIAPAIRPADSDQQIQAFSPWREIETDTLLANGGNWVSKPTICYTIENVSIANGFLYKNGSSQNVGSSDEQLFSSNLGRKIVIDKASLVSTWSGNNFFGSLLLDDYPLELLSADGHQNIRVIGKPYSHDPGYRELLDITQSTLTKFADIKQLVLYDDPTNSANKAARYRTLREALRSNLPIKKSSVSKMIYLKRGSDGDQRELDNSDEFEKFLSDNHFDIVDTSRLTPAQIAARTLDSKIVLGVEGSHLSHGIFSIADAGTLLVLQPPDRFAMVYKEFTDCMGMNFAYVVGDPAGPGQFRIDILKLQKLLDLIVAQHGY